MIPPEFPERYTPFLEARRRHAARLMALPNVVGLAVANRFFEQQPTDELSVQVYVERKIHPDLIPPQHLISGRLDGVRTDVFEVDCPHTLQLGNRPVRTGRRRPFRGGCSIGRSDGVSGTIGTVCRNTSDNGRVYVLSNNHVLVESDELRSRNRLFQPSPVDGGRSADAIGRLARKVRVRYSTAESRKWNKVDGAIAQVDPRYVDWAIEDIGVVRGVNPRPRIGTPVQKAGRTTGHTTGEVIGIGGYTMVQVRGNLAYFAEQLIVKMKVQHGDSGSLVLDDRRHAVGLLFAATRDYAIVSPIDFVQDQLRINVIAPDLDGADHGVPGVRNGLPEEFERALRTVETGLLGTREGVVAVSAGESETGAPTIEVRVSDDFRGTLPTSEGAWTVRLVRPAPV